MPDNNNNPYPQTGMGVPTAHENLVVPEAKDPEITELETRLATVEDRLDQYDETFAQLPKTPEESTYTTPLAGQVEEQTVPEVPPIEDTAINQTPLPTPYKTTYSQDTTNDPSSMENLANTLGTAQNPKQETPTMPESVPTVTPTTPPVYP